MLNKIIGIEKHREYIQNYFKEAESKVINQKVINDLEH